MDAAEKLAGEIHSSALQWVREVVGASTRPPATAFQDLQKDLLERMAKFEFSSLKHLEYNVWKRRKAKHPATQ
jgi:hypothetical protein